MVGTLFGLLKKKEFGKYLIEDFKIRKYIQKNILNSGVSDIIIERSGKKLLSFICAGYFYLLTFSKMFFSHFPEFNILSMFS